MPNHVPPLRGQPGRVQPLNILSYIPSGLPHRGPFTIQAQLRVRGPDACSRLARCGTPCVTPIRVLPTHSLAALGVGPLKAHMQRWHDAPTRVQCSAVHEPPIFSSVPPITTAIHVQCTRPAHLSILFGLMAPSRDLSFSSPRYFHRCWWFLTPQHCINAPCPRPCRFASHGRWLLSWAWSIRSCVSAGRECRHGLGLQHGACQ